MSPCVQCKAKHAPTKCEFSSCSKCCKGENGKQCDGHDLRSRTNCKKNNDREQVEQKPNENDVNETGLKPSGKKEERTREGKKAHVLMFSVNRVV